MYDWDDLRVFLAAARSGSLAGAAQKLTIDAATAGRRLSRLETALRTTLLARSPSGLRLTASGERLLDVAIEAESAMDAVARAGRNDDVDGTVRLSVAEGFGTMLLAPALPSLRAARPQLRIELAAQTGFLSSSTREVDIAITLAPPSSSRVVVEPLTDYELGLFASAAYLKRAPAPGAIEALATHEIVGYVTDLLYAPELNYLDEVSAGLRATLSSSSIRAQREIIANGGGIGILPCFMSTGLTRVLPSEVQLMRKFWLSTHRDVVDTARVRVVRDWLKSLVAEHAALLVPLHRAPD